jgi:hypothetical protein
MSNLNSLPDEIIEFIMHQVPMRDRLTSCCFVNSRFHAAAVAAPAALIVGQRDWFYPKFTVESPERAQETLDWLASYGQHMTRLVFHSFPQTLQQLQCPRLLELTVQYDCSVQLGPTVPLPGVIPGCSNLTKLELSCTILDANSGGEVCGSLSSLVHLKHLTVEPKNEQPA